MCVWVSVCASASANDIRQCWILVSISCLTKYFKRKWHADTLSVSNIHFLLCISRWYCFHLERKHTLIHTDENINFIYRLERVITVEINKIHLLFETFINGCLRNVFRMTFSFHQRFKFFPLSSQMVAKQIQFSHRAKTFVCVKWQWICGRITKCIGKIVLNFHISFTFLTRSTKWMANVTLTAVLQRIAKMLWVFSFFISGFFSLSYFTKTQYTKMVDFPSNGMRWWKSSSLTHCINWRMKLSDNFTNDGKQSKGSCEKLFLFRYKVDNCTQFSVNKWLQNLLNSLNINFERLNSTCLVHFLMKVCVKA